jgi:hypothetical protein
MSSLQATVISGRSSFQAMYSMKRDLPQPVGPLTITGRPRRIGRFVERDFVALRLVERLFANLELLLVGHGLFLFLLSLF